MTIEIGLAGSGGIEGPEDMKKGAFAASTGTGDGNDFAGQNFERDPPQGIDLGIGDFKVGVRVWWATTF